MVGRWNSHRRAAVRALSRLPGRACGDRELLAAGAVELDGGEIGARVHEGSRPLDNFVPSWSVSNAVPYPSDWLFTFQSAIWRGVDK